MRRSLASGIVLAVWMSAEAAGATIYVDDDAPADPSPGNPIWQQSGPERTAGACCDPYTGECVDNVSAADCVDPLQFTEGIACLELDPPCGNPGCCCEPPEAGEIKEPYEEFELNCIGRFVSGATGEDCDPYVFEPPCGLWVPVGLLYCPSQPDSPTFRAGVSEVLGGSPVDYFDARVGTPTLDLLREYVCVLTWVNYAYADNVAMGDVLADYVDTGGKVILGQWTYHSDQANWLEGEIMEPEYCPVTVSTSFASGSYNGDGIDCVHVGVSEYESNYLDVATLIEGASMSDGTFTTDSLAVAWRWDRGVYYSPGNTGLTYSTGDWAQLTANMCTCPAGSCEPRTIYADAAAPGDPGPGDPTVSDPLEDGTVEHPFDAIQEAIDAALAGDVVLVADGTYSGPGNRDLDYGGRAITVQSENGPETCIIYCDAGRGFDFHSGESAESVLEGFTITSGFAGDGGAIYCRASSSPTIRRCMLTDNWATSGGAICCTGSSHPTISDCIISGNDADAGDGGGIYCYTSNPTISSCLISDNGAMGYWSSPGGRGGGIGGYASSPTIYNCIINANSCSPTGEGGGGGLDFKSGSPVVANCTIAENWGGLGWGGGVCCRGSANQMVLYHCILWGDTAMEGPEIAVLDGATLTVTYGDVEGGQAAAYVQSGATLNWGEGNIDADPLFVDPNAGDFRLQLASPCVDAGDPDYVAEPGVTDLDGCLRVWDGDDDSVAIVDMGAYEFGSYPYGDMNCDGLVNFFDIEPFVLAVTDPAAYEAAYLHCDIMLADCNGDGSVDFFDIDAFVELVTGG